MKITTLFIILTFTFNSFAQTLTENWTLVKVAPIYTTKDYIEGNASDSIYYFDFFTKNKKQYEKRKLVFNKQKFKNSVENNLIFPFSGYFSNELPKDKKAKNYNNRPLGFIYNGIKYINTKYILGCPDIGYIKFNTDKKYPYVTFTKDSRFYGAIDTEMFKRLGLIYGKSHMKSIYSFKDENRVKNYIVLMDKSEFLKVTEIEANKFKNNLQLHAKKLLRKISKENNYTFSKRKPSFNELNNFLKVINKE